MTDTPSSNSLHTDQILQQLVEACADLPGFVAMSLGGSASAGLADAQSDLDIHVYWRASLATSEQRAGRLAGYADAGSVEVDMRFWGLEDHLRIGGRDIELIYVHLGDLLDEVERAYGEGLGAEGFATAQLFYVANGRPFYDPDGGLAALRERLASYPEATRRRLLDSHPALLRAYLRHLRVAQGRGDLLFVQHRRYTIQMVFFNALFALNRRYHPGEKRLLIHGERCPLRPANCATRWAAAARLAADDPALSEALAGLINDICTLIEEHP
ncbi:MAG TPA: DUF4037 domain-containing protein [Roseiflexaceae bacterium]|nr:DUF4037 domain-containing protein [Roseiflexaceae bacterium]